MRALSVQGKAFAMGLLDKLFKVSSKTNLRTRFELLREAISGTMSTFYMARDRSTKEIVGLKILDRAKTAALEGRFAGTGKPTEGEIATLFDDCAAGAIPPIGAAYGVPALVDESCDGCSELYFEGGDHHTLVHVSGDAFQALTRDARRAHISQPV